MTKTILRNLRNIVFFLLRLFDNYLQNWEFRVIPRIGYYHIYYDIYYKKNFPLTVIIDILDIHETLLTDCLSQGWRVDECLIYVEVLLYTQYS